MDICTIIAKNYLAQARVLAESFHRHHPDGRIAVLVVDDFEGHIDPDSMPFDVIGLDAIGLDDRERMAAAYDVTELSTAVKPWLLRHLLEDGGSDAITYLDPDIWILDSLEEVDTLARRHGLVLNPHFTTPLPRDGLKPSDEDILIAGTYNLGFISMSSGAKTARLLDWWAERLLHDCIVDPENGYFVDQRWIDLAPGIQPEHHILRDPGYNLAYWNLPGRKLEAEGESYTVDGAPLRFFHFSGFDPLRPNELSRHQNRLDISSSPPLSRLCRDYAEAVVEAGYEEARSWPYGWDTLPGGIRLDRCSRRLYREAVADSRLNGSVFGRKGAARLLAFLNEPDEEFGAETGLSRYLGELVRSRSDLRGLFLNVKSDEIAEDLLLWVRANAEALEIPSPLLPDRPRAASGRDQGGRSAGRSPAAGVNLAGFLGSELGVGEAARQVAASMAEVGIEHTLIDLPVDAAEMPEAVGVLTADQVAFDVSLLCVNADMVPEFVAAADPAFTDRHVIGLWFWEVGSFPDRWRGSFEPLDEVWVASQYVADSIRPSASIPVETIRLPVTPEAPTEIGRAELGMPEGYCFLLVFDHRSVLKRKNPLGLIDSFSHAFAEGSGASLVIKSVGGDSHPEDAATLRQACGAHPHVHLIEDKVSVGIKNAMIASCDCYVSLHRSEGFGLTMAEAMYFARPVIATGYSGNLDFMTEENSYLVDAKAVPVGHGAPPYPPDAEWAEPDLEHAAKLMRDVKNNREQAAAKGQRAAADIRRTHSRQAAGAVIDARLRAIAEGRAAQPPARRPRPERPAAILGTSAGMTQLQHLLEFEEAPPRPDAGRLRRTAKRIYLWLLHPYTAYERRIDLSTASALEELRVEITRREAAVGDRLERSLDERVTELGSVVKRTERRLDEIDALRATSKEETARQIEAVRTELEQASARWIEEFNKDLEQALRAHKTEQSEAMEEFSSDLERTLRAHETEQSQEMARRVSDLRASMITGLESTREALGRLAENTAELVAAARTAPFMADDRFGDEQHPALGNVLGFSVPRGEKAAGSYRGFEDVFRGSEEMIRSRQEAYLDLVRGFAPVLDVGCGRGEFLDLLEQQGIEHRGVDIDPEMIARCREKGHRKVVKADGVDYLQKLGANKLGTVFSAQVIEHLEFEQLQSFLRRSLEVLRPGGQFIAETVNPHSPRALKTFWVDPTHNAPLFPETMLALCRLAGYASAFVFCPNGNGDYETDRLTLGEYAIVASAPEDKSGRS